jgi:hypothetical protein
MESAFSGVQELSAISGGPDKIAPESSLRLSEGVYSYDFKGLEPCVFLLPSSEKVTIMKSPNTIFDLTELVDGLSDHFSNVSGISVDSIKVIEKYFRSFNLRRSFADISKMYVDLGKMAERGLDKKTVDMVIDYISNEVNKAPAKYLVLSNRKTPNMIFDLTQLVDGLSEYFLNVDGVSKESLQTIAEYFKSIDLRKNDSDIKKMYDDLRLLTEKGVEKKTIDMVVNYISNEVERSSRIRILDAESPVSIIGTEIFEDGSVENSGLKLSVDEKNVLQIAFVSEGSSDKSVSFFAGRAYDPFSFLDESGFYQEETQVNELLTEYQVKSMVDYEGVISGGVEEKMFREAEASREVSKKNVEGVSGLFERMRIVGGLGKFLIISFDKME